MMKAKRIRITTVLITALAVVLVSISGALAADTGWKDPSANAADTGGDGDGFENNPENAYTDGAPGVASNINNGGVLTGNDRHRYFDYGFSIPSGSTIDGIEVRLDWYLDRDFGTNRMHMELSGNAGSSWTTAKTDSTVTTTEHTTVLGGSTDTWSHAWTVDQLSTTNFRVRLTCDSQSPLRGFFLDWVPVKVYYTPPAGEPDLVVEKSVTIEDGNFIVSYTVTNIGSGPAGESTTCKFVDDVLNGIPDVPAVETQTCPALDSGQSYSGTFDPEPCPCGATLEVIVCADNDNVVAESDEDNNCEVNIVECPGVPDLVVEKEVTFDDDGNFIVSYKVKNQGSCPAGPSEATLYVDGSDVEHQDTPALGPGESTDVLTFTTEVTCPCGETVNVTVCADNFEAVDESDETNNYVEQDVVCPKPDLIIIDKHEIWIDTNTFNVSYKVKNQGPCPAGPSEATLYVDGLDVEHQNTPALGPSAITDEMTFDYEVTCPCGETVNVTVCADNFEAVNESDETNNCEVNFVDRDLVITDIWTDHSKIYYEIENKGSAKAPRSYSSLYVDGVFKRINDVNELAPGESSIESFWGYSWTCSSPEDTIEVCADYDRRIAESNETNNYRIETWTCPTPTPTCPDLVITEVWNVGSKIYYEIENIGGATAPVSYSRLYIDGRSERSDSVKTLAPGESSIESFSYSWSCTSSVDTIKVCADHTKRIAECKETNNCRTETWSCGPTPTPTPTPTITPTPTPPTTCPDLVITDVWNVGFKIYYEIENIGGAAAPISYSRLYIDGRSKRSDIVKTLAPGESSTESFSYGWSCTSSEDTIKVCADHTKRIAECDETNNCRTETWPC